MFHRSLRKLFGKPQGITENDYNKIPPAGDSRTGKKCERAGRPEIGILAPLVRLLVTSRQQNTQNLMWSAVLDLSKRSQSLQPGRRLDSFSASGNMIPRSSPDHSHRRFVRRTGFCYYRFRKCGGGIHRHTHKEVTLVYQTTPGIPLEASWEPVARNSLCRLSG